MKYEMAQLLADTIYCDRTEFSYTSSAPKIKVPFTIAYYGGSFPLDNPDNLDLEIYKCEYMADNCGMCHDIAEKYGCGWCQNSNKCKVRDQCDNGSGLWLNRSQTCPNPEISSVQPQLGLWEGETNVTIQGINLGKSVTDVGSVTVAGLPCQLYPELYIKNKQIVCRVDGPGNSTTKGPVIVGIDDFRGYSEFNFEFVNPVIESISPRRGPRSGRTVIRITGRHMNAGSKIQATIGDLPCSIISTQANETLCLASASNGTDHARLRMKFDHATREFDGFFEYVDDPTINTVTSGLEGSVQIPKGIPAGGIKVSVTGANFEPVQNPQMYVYHDDKMFVSQCEALNDTNMICDTPSIEVTENLDADQPLSLEYGFIMNNVTGVQNLSANGFVQDFNNRYRVISDLTVILTSRNSSCRFVSFLLYPNPVYEKFEDQVKHYRGDYLVLDGQHLDRACQESDVIVQIGNSFCNVTALSRNQLVCRPPPVQPQPLKTEGDLEKQELPEVIVTVGGKLKFNIGRLSYATIQVTTCVNNTSN